MFVWNTTLGYEHLYGTVLSVQLVYSCMFGSQHAGTKPRKNVLRPTVPPTDWTPAQSQSPGTSRKRLPSPEGLQGCRFISCLDGL